jgi:hypothetical protein
MEFEVEVARACSAFRLLDATAHDELKKTSNCNASLLTSALPIEKIEAPSGTAKKS